MGGSIGYGVVEFREGLLTAMYDETNSILQPVPGFGHGYILVNGATFGPDGTFWISTSLTDNPVYRRTAQGQWESIVLNYGGFGSDTRIGEILVTKDGDIWLLVQNDGILVFRETAAGNFEERFFNVQNQRGDLLDRVYSIAEDKDGNIWVGSNKGPVVFYDPFTIFEVSEITGYQPEIPRNDGTLFIDFLLSTEKINSISVDGANRKWLTTEKSGVYLVSEDGKKETYHFMEVNSPLLSDNVQTATINDKTGEVFFGTEKGIISFRGEATEGDDDFGNVYVFPNPVRENYNGDVTVTGLIKDASVKITDISGNLVFETKSLGGQAIWDGKNFSGDRVHTGVYLVFCSNKDGSKTRVTKLLFIH
jgi:ligand-binding sensor domain-containing protein